MANHALCHVPLENYPKSGEVEGGHDYEVYVILTQGVKIGVEHRGVKQGKLN